MNNTASLVRQKKIQEFAVGIFKLVFIVGICYLFLFPVLNMIITSFKTIESAEDPTVIWIPTGLSLDGIKQAWQELKFSQAAPMSLTITIFSTLCALVSCSLAGYGLARFKFFGKSLIMTCVILTIIIPPQVLFSSTYLNFRFFDFGGLLSIFGVSLNLLDSSWVFILPAMFATGLRNGIFIFVFYSFFKGLPVEMEEAAKIDGCGVFKTYLSVMIPMAVPAFITVMLFSIVWHWTDYQSSATYFTQEVKPLVVMLSGLKDALSRGGVISTTTSNFAVRIYVQAGALLCVAPPLILYMFTQKYFTESIERTGLVG